jgi:hypothetical protein
LGGGGEGSQHGEPIGARSTIAQRHKESGTRPDSSRCVQAKRPAPTLRAPGCARVFLRRAARPGGETAPPRDPISRGKPTRLPCTWTRQQSPRDGASAVVNLFPGSGAGSTLRCRGPGGRRPAPGRAVGGPEASIPTPRQINHPPNPGPNHHPLRCAPRFSAARASRPSLPDAMPERVQLCALPAPLRAQPSRGLGNPRRLDVGYFGPPPPFVDLPRPARGGRGDFNLNPEKEYLSGPRQARFFFVPVPNFQSWCQFPTLELMGWLLPDSEHQKKSMPHLATVTVACSPYSRRALRDLLGANKLSDLA